MSNEPFGYVFESFCLPESSDEFEWVELFQRANPVNGSHVRGITPVYTHPVDDTALLRQALEALERGRPQIIGVLVKQDQDAAITALRERLGEKT